MEELIPPFTENTPQAGFRLQYLEVFNWGTFNKVRWQIQLDGHNTLLTGDIGSGKSTLVDALTCLLVPHNKIVFNKAADAEGKERNLLSYVKGEYKKEKEEITKVARKVYLRPIIDDNTYTVIIAVLQTFDLRKRTKVQLFNDNFTQYSGRLFGMTSVFYQTVSMKSVSSLTDFCAGTDAGTNRCKGSDIWKRFGPQDRPYRCSEKHQC